MSSIPLFSSVPIDRPVFPMRSLETLLTTSLAGIIPASRLEVRPAPELVSSGVRELDALTGGLPRGCLTEVCGSASSGRTSLLLAILASATHRQEACALVDVTDSFDPESAASAAVNFQKLLWVRCGAGSLAIRQKNTAYGASRGYAVNVNPAPKGRKKEHDVEQALRVTDLLLQSGGFGLVAIDLADVPFKTARRIPLTSWFRFQRAVEHTPTVLLVITQSPCAQTCAALLLRMQSAMKKPSAFSSPLSVSENPSHTELFETFEIHTEVLRSRIQRKPSRSVASRFKTKAVRAG
jgi:RecA DNA recombination protein